MIIDAFLILNELDLLEVRLVSLSSVVDRFVIIEGTRTHQGTTKPLNFLNNKKRFEPFLDKISYSVFDEFSSTDPWKNEKAHRNSVFGALRCFPKEAVVHLSDIDEIPTRDVLMDYHDSARDKVCALEQEFYYYYLNLRCRTKWNSARLCQVSHILDRGAQVIRMEGGELIRDAGVHLSYLGGPKQIRYKLESFAHTEYNSEEFKGLDVIEKKITHGIDLFNRDGMIFDFLKPEEVWQNMQMPSAIRLNPQKYQSDWMYDPAAEMFPEGRANEFGTIHPRQ